MTEFPDLGISPRAQSSGGRALDVDAAELFAKPFVSARKGSLRRSRPTTKAIFKWGLTCFLCAVELEPFTGLCSPCYRERLPLVSEFGKAYSGLQVRWERGRGDAYGELRPLRVVERMSS
jgi:hypothetical protein